MSATKNFIATWPELGISIECAPNEDGSNKWIYDWYIAHMPIRFVQLHAMCTGTIMYTFCRVSEDLPLKGNNVLVNTMIDNTPVGGIHLAYNIPNGLAGGRNAHIGMFYDNLSWEHMPGYISGRVIPRDLPKLKEAGYAVARSIYRTKKVITCALTVKD
jgi:hypothetical protein